MYFKIKTERAVKKRNGRDTDVMWPCLFITYIYLFNSGVVVFKLQKLFICEDYQDKRNNYRLLLVTELIFCNKEEGTRVILTSGVAYTKNISLYSVHSIPFKCTFKAFSRCFLNINAYSTWPIYVPGLFWTQPSLKPNPATSLWSTQSRECGGFWCPSWCGEGGLGNCSFFGIWSS